MRPLPREFELDGIRYVSVYELYLHRGLPKKKWTKWYRMNILECEELIENDDYCPLELTASEKESNVMQNFALNRCLEDVVFSNPLRKRLAKNWQILHPGLNMERYPIFGKVKNHDKIPDDMIPGIVKQLPLEINRRGATYNLVRRGKQTLLYARNVAGETRSYEVFEIRTRRLGNINGQIIPASEIFPHDEAFGYWAKCTFSLERALRHFNHHEEHGTFLS